LPDALARIQEHIDARVSVERSATRETIDRLNERVAGLEAELARETNARQCLEAELTMRTAELQAERDRAAQTERELRELTRSMERAVMRDLTSSSTEAVPKKDLAGRPSPKERSRRKIGEMLIDARIVSNAQLERALKEQASPPRRHLGTILVQQGVATDESVAQILAQQLNLPFVNLAHEHINADIPRLIKGHIARRRMCIPIAATTDRVVLAMANPLDLLAIDDVQFACGRRVDPVVAAPSDISALLSEWYGNA
jgi:hypothetical protein